jgi:hypothetical protein
MNRRRRFAEARAFKKSWGNDLDGRIESLKMPLIVGVSWLRSGCVRAPVTLAVDEGRHIDIERLVGGMMDQNPFLFDEDRPVFTRRWRSSGGWL